MKNQMTTLPLLSDEFYLWADEIERSWRLSTCRKSEAEWLSLFPEAIEVIPDKILEWQDELDEIEHQANDFIHNINAEPLARELITEWVIFDTAIRILRIKKHLSRLKRGLPRRGYVDQPNKEEQIEQARNVSLIELAMTELHLVKRGANYSALCPFHTEKTPSFFVFPQRNTFKCFGCQKSGDVITYYMEIRSVTFLEAVQQLAGGAL